jgi:hypothetical protein
MSTSTPNDPPNQSSITPDMIAKAVSDGVKQVFMSDEVLAALSRTGDGGQGGSTARNISSASTVNAVADALKTSGIEPGATSSHASMAKDVLANTSLSGEYMRLPQGLGNFEGRITAQNIAQYANARNNARIGQLPEGSFYQDDNGKIVASTPEAGAAIRSANRIGFMQNTAIPAYTIMKNAYQQYMAPAVQAAQGLAGLGYTQTVGPTTPIGALKQGVGIGLHNMGQVSFGGYAQKMLGIDGLIDPLTFAKQQEISGAVMGEGFNFNNSQYGLIESGLQNAVRYNAGINVQLASQQMGETTRRAGGAANAVQGVADVASSLHRLGEVAKESNLSIAVVQQRMNEFQAMTGYGSGSASNFTAIQKMYPGMAPTSALNMIQSTPLGQSAALSNGMYPGQVTAVARQKGNAPLIMGTMNQTLGDALAASGFDSSKMNDQNYMNEMFVTGKNAGKNLGSLNMFGFNNQMDLGELASLVEQAPRREKATQALEYLSNTSEAKGGYGRLGGNALGENMRVNPKTGSLEVKDQLGRWQDDRGGRKIGTADRFQYTEKEVLSALNQTGIKGKKAQDILDENFYTSENTGIKGRVLKKGGASNISQYITKEISGAGDKPSADKLQKVIDGLDNAVAGMKDFKNSLPDQ